MLEIGLKTQWSCTPFLMLNKLTKKPQKQPPPTIILLIFLKPSILEVLPEVTLPVLETRFSAAAGRIFLNKTLTSKKEVLACVVSGKCRVSLSLIETIQQNTMPAYSLARELCNSFWDHTTEVTVIFDVSILCVPPGPN